MDVLMIGCINIMAGIVFFFLKEQILERQQRLYTKIFGRRLNYINIKMYVAFIVLLELFGFSAIIIGIKQLI